MRTRPSRGTGVDRLTYSGTRQATVKVLLKDESESEDMDDDDEEPRTRESAQFRQDISSASTRTSRSNLTSQGSSLVALLRHPGLHWSKNHQILSKMILWYFGPSHTRIGRVKKDLMSLWQQYLQRYPKPLASSERELGNLDLHQICPLCYDDSPTAYRGDWSHLVSTCSYFADIRMKELYAPIEALLQQMVSDGFIDTWALRIPEMDSMVVQGGWVSDLPHLSRMKLLLPVVNSSTGKRLEPWQVSTWTLAERGILDKRLLDYAIAHLSPTRSLTCLKACFKELSYELRNRVNQMAVCIRKAVVTKHAELYSLRFDFPPVAPTSKKAGAPSAASSGKTTATSGSSRKRPRHRHRDNAKGSTPVDPESSDPERKKLKRCVQRKKAAEKPPPVMFTIEPCTGRVCDLNRRTLQIPPRTVQIPPSLSSSDPVPLCDSCTRPRSLTIRGDGGEAEIRPDSECELQWVDEQMSSRQIWQRQLSKRDTQDQQLDPERLRLLWRGECDEAYGEAAVLSTLACCLVLLGQAQEQNEASHLATIWWQNRNKLLM